jgi:UDP:flavonoid glycosyltransferase YjiC (YdhE family)
MARIVITSWGSFGDVNPYLGLALALRARGHSAVLAIPSAYREVAAREGLEFHAVGPDVDPTDLTLVRRLMDPRKGSEVVLRELLFSAVDQSYRDLAAAAEAADVLVSHPVTFAAPVLAEQRRLPWVSTVLAPMSFFSAYDLPVLPPVPSLKRLERLGHWASASLVWLAKRSIRQWSAPVARLRARLGLPPGQDPVFEGQHSPDLVLALFSRLLAKPQPDWPPNALITGQVVYDAAHGETLSPEIEAFLKQGPPPIVFTLGSSAVLASGAFYDESAAAARRLGRRAVLLAGPDGVKRLAGALPPEVLVVDAAPHSRLFPRALAIVHQGGIGTLGQALRSGRPMLVVPFAHDQPDNAFRARALGVARIVYPREYRAARAAAELECLIEDAAYERAAREVGAASRAEDGPGVASDAIDRYTRHLAAWQPGKPA